MLVKDYITQVCTINSYLTAFPTKPGREPTKLPTDEVPDLLEFGFPLKWQRAMHLHGLKPQEGTIKDFATFCKHLEFLLEDTESKSNKKGSSKDDSDCKKGGNNCSNSKKKRRRNNRKINKEKNSSISYMIKNNTQHSNQCRTFQHDAEKTQRRAQEKNW